MYPVLDLMTLERAKCLLNCLVGFFSVPKSTRSKNQMVVLFDKSPLVVLDCGNAIQDTNAILKWYAARYDIDYTRLTCCWCDVIPNLHPLLNRDMGL